MKSRTQNFRFYPDKLDFCIYLGLLQWISITEALRAGGSWNTYLFSASALCVSQLPVLVFSWKKEVLKKTLSPPQYRRYRIAGFGIYLPLLALGSSLMLDAKTALWKILVLGAVCTLWLALVLHINGYFARQVSSSRWIQKFSLEKAIFISITFLAAMLAAMAVSSLDNPLYHTKQQLLIGFEFNPVKILYRFGTFLSYSAQLLLMYLCGYFFFMINSKILVNKVLKEKGVLLYLLSALAIVGIFYPIMGQSLSMLPFSRQLGGVFSPNPFVWENAFGAILVLLISLPILLAVQWSKQNTRIVLLEKEKAYAELDLLKQQLNPHFFFNTLNNLYALSLQNSKQTPELILQLSDLMRYVIYKAREPYVPVTDEVQYIQDYLQLQSIRLKEKFDLRFDRELADEKFKIAPLLLIVFIENAFKHGIEPLGGRATLHVLLKTDNSKLYFSCENSFEPETENHAGIGLDNLHKRLNLLYPGKHRLQIKKENAIFKAELELENYEYALPDR